MDHVAIIKKAFRLTFRHKALWLFGLLLALTGGGGGGGSFPSGRGSGTGWREDVVPDFGPEVWATVSAIIVALILIGIVAAIVATIIRYVAHAGLLGATREAATAGQVSIRQGFRFGWSRTAWRLFLIDLAIGIPLMIAILLLLLLAASPVLLSLVITGDVSPLPVIITVLAGLVVLGLLIPVSVAISVLSQFFARRCAFADRGVVESIRGGYHLVRQRLKDVAVMWLVMFGVGIVWGIAFFVMSVIPAGLVGVGIGIPAFMLTQSADAWLPILISALPAILVFGAIASALTALYTVFQYHVWTLTYLEVAAEPEASGQ
jgi:hypothetical protein